MESNLLEKFINCLQSGQVSSNSIFSDKVKSDILIDYNDLQKYQSTLDIEPVDIKILETDNKIGKKIKFEGSFIYGFIKNGIFHTIPGDLQSQIKRTANEKGYFSFQFDQSGLVVDIYESLAGNHFGIGRKEMSIWQKIKLYTNIAALIILLAILAIFWIFVIYVCIHNALK